MKKSFIILAALILSSNANCEIGLPRAVGYTGLTVFAAIIMIVPYDYINQRYTELENKNGLILTLGIDPKMAFHGDIDFRSGIGFKFGKLESWVMQETFPAIGYNSISLSAGYTVIDRRLSLVILPEVTKIWRDVEYVKETNQLSYGLNINHRLLLTNRLSTTWTWNLRTRPEISKDAVFSTFIHLNYLLWKY